MAKQRPREVGVSLEVEDATRGIGIGPGPAKIVKAQYEMYKYASGNRYPACMVTFERGGEDLPPEPYTVGQGWTVSSDGQSLIPKAAQTGLPDNCKFMMLLKSLRECEMPKGAVKHPEDLVGTEGTLILQEMGEIQDRKGRDGDKGSKDRKTSKPSVMVFEEVTAAPWMEEEAPTKGKKKKPAVIEDDTEEEDEEDEDEESEDENNAVTAKLAAKNGKAPHKVVAKDDDDEDVDADESGDEVESNPLDDPAGEALIEALEAGPLKTTKIEGAVAAQVKGHKQAKNIAARAADPEFYKQQLGWKVKKDAKLGLIVTL